MAISRHNLVPDLPDNNFATFDEFYSDHHTLSQGNLSAYSTNQSASFAYANFAFPNFGKWYVEIRVASGIGGTSYSHIGVQPALTRNQKYETKAAGTKSKTSAVPQATSRYVNLSITIRPRPLRLGICRVSFCTCSQFSETDDGSRAPRWGRTQFSAQFSEN